MYRTSVDIGIEISGRRLGAGRVEMENKEKWVKTMARGHVWRMLWINRERCEVEKRWWMKRELENIRLGRVGWGTGGAK